MAQAWDAVPVVGDTQAAPPVAAARPARGYRVERQAYTNETPEELTAQGYQQDDAGTWFKVVGTEQAPSAAWRSVPVAPEPTGSQTLADEQTRRMLTANGDTAARENTFMNGVLFGAADEIGGRVAQAGQATRNLGRRLSGQPIEVNSADVNDAYVRNYRDSVGEFTERHPVQSLGLSLAGGGLTGGGVVGGGVRGAIATGAAYGGAYGFGSSEGTFAERLPGAATGAVVGGALGGTVQAAAPYARRLAGIASAGTRPIRETASRMVGRPAEPNVVAARRIADQLRRRGLSEDQIAAETTRFREAGLNPSVVDVGGENVMATVRAAASGEGPGRQLVTDYRDRVASELTPRVVERTRRLIPDETRDSYTLADDLTRSRNTAARDQYGPAYAAVIEVPDIAIRALRGPEGTQAMASARRLASAEQRYDVAAEIDALATADLDQLPMASGRALETIRRAMADEAAGLSESSPGLSNALMDRVRQLDDALDNVPGLTEARGNYRAASEQIDAVGGVPRNGRQRLGRPDRAPVSAITAPAPQYSSYLDSLRPQSGAANQVYQRDALINRLSNSKDGAVGALNALTPGRNAALTENAPYIARNLEATFPGHGQQYQQDINLAREQMTFANRISPNDGSQTASRLGDQAGEMVAAGLNGAASVATGGKWALVKLGLDNLIRNVGLNEAERAAIVELGIGSADEIQNILRVAAESRRMGSPPPAEVQAWLVRTRNTLGSQNPVSQQIEQLLLPSPVLAGEEQQ